MLVLAPVMCVLGGIAVSASLSSYMKYFAGGAASILGRDPRWFNITPSVFIIRKRVPLLSATTNGHVTSAVLSPTN